MDAKVFATTLLTMLGSRLAELPWLISAAEKDDWSRQMLGRIRGGCPIEDDEDNLFRRTNYPQASIAALAVFKRRPGFDTLETVFSRLYWSGPLADSPVSTQRSLAEVEGAAKLLGVYQLRYLKPPEFAAQCEETARKLGVIEAGESLAALDEAEVKNRLRLLDVSRVAETSAA